MRITFLSPFASLVGGVRVVAVYAAELQARGHDVRVVSLSRKKPKLKARMMSMIGLKKLKAQKAATPLLDVLGDKHIVLPHHEPITADEVPDGDVVIATFWETAPWVADLPPSKGRKFYLLQDYETFKVGKTEAVSATYELPLRKIAVSNYIADMLSEHHGITDTLVVPNSVDQTQFNTPPRGKNPQLTVGFLYTGKPRKNVKLALQVIEKAREVLPDLKVVAFGSIPPVERLPLPDWVEYHQTPAQADIPKIYASCDAWLFTSDHEGFGLPILEAMACGTPVIATRAGAAPKIINGANGTLLDSDRDVFVDELVRLAGLSGEAWQEMSDAARNTARSYTWSDATDLLLEFLSEE